MEINNLKINQEINDIKEQLNALLNIFYPIGSYYETSKIDFNPNISWGGTWVQDTVGLVTVGADTKNTTETENALSLQVGEEYGEKNHTLTIDEMPSHFHSGGGDYIINKGTSDVWGVAFSNVTGWCAVGVVPDNLTTGNSQSHNNVQPSIGVIRWHRTA